MNCIILLWLCAIDLLASGMPGTISAANRGGAIVIRVVMPATDLLAAVKANQTQTCKALINQGADVNQRGQFGDTPLSWAVDNQNLELVRLLLAQGANPNVSVEGLAYNSGDAPGETPLIGAIRCNNMPIFQMLMESKGIDVNGRIEDGATPLTEACDPRYRLQPININMVRTLLERGADPNLSRKGYEPPLATAIPLLDPQTAETLVKLFLDHGARVTDLCMFAAANSGRVEVFKLLLAHGGNPNAWNPAFGSLLKAAAQRCQTEMVAFLLANGANVNEISKDGLENSTALTSVAHLIYFPDGNGRDAGLRAARQIAMMKLLMDAGADPNARPAGSATALMQAVIAKNSEAVKLLLARGADVKALDAGGNSAVMWAVALGTPDLIELLLSNGASLDVKNRDGETALIHATHYANLTVVKYLLDKGADVNARDGNGNTALIARASLNEFGYARESQGILNLLMAHGADPNASNTLGQTALMFAVHFQAINAINVLIAHGAHVNARDKQGKSVMSYATETQQKALIELLKRAGAR
jgi:ankyrin repeat protein